VEEEEEEEEFEEEFILQIFRLNCGGRRNTARLNKGLKHVSRF
jgi:hypothetical protein